MIGIRHPDAEGVRIQSNLVLSIPFVLGNTFFIRDGDPRPVGDDIALADLFISFLFSVGLGDVHESGGKRVVGSEGGGKADDGK